MTGKIKNGNPAAADDLPALAGALREVALEAGALIMKIYEDAIAVRHKDDRSPVTDADEGAEKIILAALARLSPDIPVVAEESVTARGAPKIEGTRFWLVDPLDGTKEFISRNGEFTVNIALIEQGHPTLGVVYAPAAGRLFIAAGKGRAFAQEKLAGGNWGNLHPITARVMPKDGLIAVASRSHRDAETDAFLTHLPVGETRSAGSSLKFCLVAAGEADIYPRFGPTMEWDTGAGHAVLAAAGGSVETPEGKAFTYGKKDFRNGNFIAYGRKD
jgi:3'(2'), 5'-bisphosphate nucleotidase